MDILDVALRPRPSVAAPDATGHTAMARLIPCYQPKRLESAPVLRADVLDNQDEYTTKVGADSQVQKVAT
jgi:hypothetical protein